jgi:hypothetical protein
MFFLDDDDIEKYELEHIKQMIKESRTKDSNFSILKGYFPKRKSDRVSANEIDLAQEVFTISNKEKSETYSNKMEDAKEYSLNF